MNFTVAQLGNFYFSLKNKINIPCRFCETGVLVGVKGGINEESAASKRHQKMPYSNAEDYEGVAAMLFQCNNKNCEEVYVTTGKVFKEELTYYDEYDGEETFEGYELRFHPSFFQPSIDLFRLPKEVPQQISNGLRSAFALFFADQNSCANKIRVTVEQLITELGIPVEKGNGVRYKLHDRITLLKDSGSDLGEHLEAIKWIGNSGSHMENLAKKDIIDAFEILEDVLDELFIRNHKKNRIEVLYKAINLNKGPRQ